MCPISFSTPFPFLLFILSISFPGYMRLVLKQFQFLSALSHHIGGKPKDSNSFWRALTSRNEEKTEDTSRALHGENFGICAFFQPSEPPETKASASVLSPACSSVKISSIQLQVHFVQQFILLTLARHLLMTTRGWKKSLPLFTLPLHLQKRSD